MEIAKLLSNRNEAILLDKMLFLKWEEGMISTLQTIRQFKRNNRLADSIDIPTDEMIAFMNGLGYLREVKQ